MLKLGRFFALLGQERVRASLLSDTSTNTAAVHSLCLRGSISWWPRAVAPRPGALPAADTIDPGRRPSRGTPAGAGAGGRRRARNSDRGRRNRGKRRRPSDPAGSRTVRRSLGLHRLAQPIGPGQGYPWRSCPECYGAESAPGAGGSKTILMTTGGRRNHANP